MDLLLQLLIIKNMSEIKGVVVRSQNRCGQIDVHHNVATRVQCCYCSKWESAAAQSWFYFVFDLPLFIHLFYPQSFGNGLSGTQIHRQQIYLAASHVHFQCTYCTGGSYSRSKPCCLRCWTMKRRYRNCCFLIQLFLIHIQHSMLLYTDNRDRVRHSHDDLGNYLTQHQNKPVALRLNQRNPSLRAASAGTEAVEEECRWKSWCD